MNRTTAAQPPAQLLAQAWASYSHAVVPSSAPAVQRQECRRSFMAGAHALLQHLNSAVDLQPADRDALATALRTELATFLATVGTSLEGKV